MSREMGKKRPPSVKWKIFLFLLGFCLLLLVVLWLFQTVFLESFYTSIKLSQVEQEAENLAALLENGDRATFEDAIRARGDLYVELVDEQGQSSTVEGFFPEFGMGVWSDEQRADLYSQTRENGGSLSLRYKPQGDDMPQPNGQGDTRHPIQDMDVAEGMPPVGKPDKWGGESVLHAEIITTPQGEDWLLLVRAAITPVNATVETLRTQLWYISAIMVVLAVGIALLIANRVAKPIETLNRAAGELGRGNYDVVFTGEGYREAAELSATLNETAKELGKTEELRRDLIANVSHDLQTPLTLIIGYAEMMRDIPGENTPENMQVIIEEAGRLSSLVGDLLGLSRLQSGTSELRLEHFNLTHEVAGIIGRFAKFSEPEGYVVRFENNNGEVWVEADSHRIAQVVYNFLINAMTHGGQNRLIRVEQTVQNGRVRIAVADSGEGIAPEKLPHIWERYYKVDKVHKRSVTGSGLGLSIVKSILEQHPGIEYGAESVQGQGSTFWFTLPVQ